ncbi:MAG: inositol phosphorylceramide synthase [Proteobacteria bacterium]|nr:inositol phosphorylceramide synthase [Pseudomonadota bacterium]
MNLVPNYVVNPVDIEGIYQAEKSLFGIVTAAGTLTPNEFFTLHNHPVVDFLCGCFYLCWVPVPMLFGIYLYFARKEKAYLHFALVFLLVNYIGFVGYYLHPAAPPWYYAQFGPELIHNTGGSAAGLAAFDKIIGADMFTTIYTRTSNVFAAVPSLHSAYTFVAFIYSVHAKAPRGWQIALGIITVGIWFTAVYTSHHYIIDVILGMGCALLGYWLFEYGLMRIRPFAKFINGYVSYITPKK